MKRYITLALLLVTQAFAEPGPKEGGKGDGPLPPTVPVQWEAGKTKVLVIGGGSSHNFAKFFGDTDVATLKAAGYTVHYTEDRDQAADLLAEADVAFTPTGGRPATGRTDTAGRFSLTTFKTNDGAMIGQHTVTVCKHIKKDPNATGAYFDYVQVTPENFGRPNESPLRAEVTASGPNEFTFDVTPGK
jgi:hypothetical protein